MADVRSSGGRLFVLDLSRGRVLSLEPDGSDPKTLITGCRLPDGLAVDSAAGYIYWTNMGIPHRNDGSIERADLDGGNRRFIIPEGGTFTPKQLHLDKTSGKLYWSDREGMRVMRANLDGSQIETLIQTGEGEGDRTEKHDSHRRTRSACSPARSLRSSMLVQKQVGQTIVQLPHVRQRSATYRSRSIWRSISSTASSIGPIGANLRAATR